MSPFVVLKQKLQHERYGAGGAPTTNESTRANAAGSNPTSKAQDTQTTASGGVVVSFRTTGETAVQSLPGQWRCRPDWQTAWSAFEQSSARENYPQSAAVAALALS